MIRDYFKSSTAQKRICSSRVGPYLDGFAASLAAAGYSPYTIDGYLRAAAHLGWFADRRGVPVSQFDHCLVGSFRCHLSRCRCRKGNKGVFGDALPGSRSYSLTFGVSTASRPRHKRDQTRDP